MRYTIILLGCIIILATWLSTPPPFERGSQQLSHPKKNVIDLSSRETTDDKISHIEKSTENEHSLKSHLNSKALHIIASIEKLFTSGKVSQTERNYLKRLIMRKTLKLNSYFLSDNPTLSKPESFDSSKLPPEEYKKIENAFISELLSTDVYPPGISRDEYLNKELTKFKEKIEQPSSYQ
ncbi:hypothetical protein [Pleionea sediminis]|uniref:hypothetical protein n=1 Tax=Pleionea sediminis TaxID=2569479 RepID=UPI0011854A5C|nr:hypothetical protein [Pleionea sediminis]